jgi:hypothetical protein
MAASEPYNALTLHSYDRAKLLEEKIQSGEGASAEDRSRYSKIIARIRQFDPRAGR